MDKKDTVIVLLPVEEGYRRQMEEALPGAAFIWTEGGIVPPEAWEKASAILGNPTLEQAARCPNLRWIQLGSAGTDGYCAPGALPEPVALTNATGCYGHAISEYMVGTTLMLMKKLHLYRDSQMAERWQDAGAVMSVTSSRILVVGMGDIGGAYAQRMKLLGAHITGVTRTAHPKPDYADKAGTIDQLDGFLPQADVVALSLPGGEKTAKLMDRRRLGLMKRGALLLNVGRGSAIDTDALYDLLESGQLGGAALDVTDPEPLPEGHPLWKCPSAFITPHTSGGYHMRETYEAIMAVCIENLKAFAAGRPFTHQVDRETGYMRRG